tara:strand:- start:747 stop:935 length:189 start_codon:yes stop_codon:yes gene_type:complete
MTIQDLINRYPSRVAAAKVAQVTRGTIHNWMTGSTKPELFGVLRLCAEMNVDPMDLLVVRDG